MAEREIRFDDGAAYEQMMELREPDRRLCLSRLARAAPGVELDRRWMWQRRLHGVDRRALRTC